MKKNELDNVPTEPTAERAVIGAAIAEPALAAELDPEWFYDLRHRQAAVALLDLATEGKGIEPGLVALRLRDGGLQTPEAFVAECLDACHSPAHFPVWRGLLTQKLMLRRVIRLAHESIADAIATDRDGGDVAEFVDRFERNALGIGRNASNDGDGAVDLRNAIRELIDDYERARRDGKAIGLHTGFPDLDKLVGGLRDGQLVILAARPAVGKTSLAMNIAERIAIDGQIPVGFFSLEMSGKELVHRLACARARVDGTRLNDGTATDAQIHKLTVAHAHIVRAPLHIHARGGLTLAQLTAQARRMKKAHGIRMLVVDYLGLVRSGEKGRSRYEETTLVSNGLKALAMELQVCVVALAQLNRDTDREGRAPRLSDLRDSGSIEQDADVVCLLHRSHDGDSEAGDQTSLIVAKNRAGGTGRVPLVFLREFTRFESAAPVG